MHFSWRKIFVALIALQVILAAYLLFVFLGAGTSIEVDKSQTAKSDIVTDANGVGKVGSLEIGNVEKAKFVSFDEAGQISREFGFEELLHKTGDEWKIAKPYLNIYQPQFDCRITADTGVMLADDLTDTTNIKEASLKENVVIHISSKGTDGPGLMDIYLDDIEFITDRSLLLTSGPVKMLADDMQLLGTGMEIVYDYSRSRLEMFRIIELESLCLNRIETESESTNDAPTDSAEKNKSQISTEQEMYKAVLNSNVAVRMKNQFLLADDKLIISNIAPKQTSPDPNKTDSQDDSAVKAKSVSREKAFDVVASCEHGLVIYPMDVSKPKSAILSSIDTPTAGESDFLRIAESPDVNSLRAETIDIDAITRRTTGSGRVTLKYRSAGSRPVNITSLEGFTFNPDLGRVSFEGGSTVVFDSQEQNQYTLTADQITAVLAKESYADELNNLKHITAMGNVTIVAGDKLTGKDTARFTAPRVDYFAEGSDIMSTGQSELTLYRDIGSSKNQSLIVTAKESVRFEPKLDSVIFTGDCYSQTIDYNSPEPRKYTLSSDTLTLELMQQQDAAAETLNGIKKVTADGGAVVSVISVSDENIISEFTANKIVYDSEDEDILADGPSRLVLYELQPELSGQISEAPMTITSQLSTRYSLPSGRAVFSGLCECNIIRLDNGTPRKYRLTAPQITVDIAAAEKGFVGSFAIESVIAGDNAIIIVTPVNSVTELARFTAATMNYNASADKIVADGPCDFTFYANDFVQTETLGAAVPVQIHAEQKTTFQPNSNRLTFEGDCIGTMLRNETDSQSRYTLSAPRLTAELSRQQEKGLAASILGIDKFTADGGIVQISNVRTASNRLVTFSKIKCQKFIYDTDEKLFTALGPGIVTVDNSNVEELNIRTDRFGIRKKCYAFLRDFETLKYDMQANRITAHNTKTKMLADYFPIENKDIQQHIMASAGIIEMQLTADALGRGEISGFRAYRGITYEDSDNQFIADEMIYDAKASTIRATGSENQSCYLNGAIVDNLIYDINRQAVLNVDITRPGMVQPPARR
ncbi:MAG: hypothetical protein WC962_02055 [Phycisphaerae bacterium]|jgi:hypothetical protein